MVQRCDGAPRDQSAHASGVLIRAVRDALEQLLKKPELE
jgi:hypothetical protein